MKFLDLFRKKGVFNVQGEKNSSHQQVQKKENESLIVERKPDWEGSPISEVERETVALITSAIAAGAYPESQFRITKITPIDTDYEIAGVICAAIAAGDYPDSAFRIKSIKRVS